MTKTTERPPEAPDKSAVPRKRGMTHGVRAFVDSGKLPSGRQYRRAMREVSRLRGLLIVKYGGGGIEPDVLALVDSAAKAMMVQELCALYIEKYGILRGDSLNAGNLELHSVLARSYASYANLVRLNLEAAARLAERRRPEAAPLDLGRYIEAHDAAKEAAKEGSVRTAPGRAAAGQDEGKDRKPAKRRRTRAGAGKEAPGLTQDGRRPGGQGVGSGR